MGIADWFSGRKAKFREAAKEKLAGGDLSKDKLIELETLRKELDAEPLSAERTMGRRELFNLAVESVKAGGRLSKEQDRELARLQKYLALRNDQIDKTRTDLKRFRTVEQIGQGQLPVVSPDNVALRGLGLEDGEVPHCCVPADLYEAPEAPSGIGVRVNHDAPYQPGSSHGLELPVGVAARIDEGFVIVSSKRFIFKGGQIFGHKLAQNQNFFLYEDGIRMPFARGHLLFKLRGEGQAEVIGSLITSLKGF
jgi:hypothetical protein